MSAGDAAKRRFEAMIATASHRSTPREEALTALEGARRVAGKHEITGSARRIDAVEAILGIRKRPEPEPAEPTSMFGRPPRTPGRPAPRSPWRSRREIDETARKLREFAESLSQASGTEVFRGEDGIYRRRKR